VENFLTCSESLTLPQYLSTQALEESIQKGAKSLCLNEDLSLYKADPAKTLFVEQKVNIADVFIGFVDLIVKWSGGALIVDHKFLSNKKYIPSQEDLLADPQTAVYPYAVATFFDLPDITFEYHYYGTMAKWHEKRKINLTRAQIEDIWDAVKTKSFDVLDNYKESNFQNTTTNYFSCSAFGGCEYLDYCFK
jgi:hypothetical protein